MQTNTTPLDTPFDAATLVADLNALLRLKTTVIGMKMFASIAGDGGDPENPPPECGSHHGSDRQHGIAARLDRRHYGG